MNISRLRKNLPEKKPHDHLRNGRWGWIWALSLCVGGLNACAYHPGFGDRTIPGGYHALSVPVFKNATAEAGVEVYFTNAFIREMQRSRIGSVTDKDNAQVTVEGVVNSIQYVVVDQIQGSQIGLPANTVLNKQYRIVVTSTLRLRRNSDRKLLWEGQFSKEQTYQTPRIAAEELTGANALYNHSARYQNIELLAADMMAEAHDRMTENF